METRCVRCGKTIQGLAQFCDACLAELAEREPPTQVPAQPEPTPGPAGGEAPGFATFALVAAGGCAVIVALWLFLLGGSKDLGLSGGDSPQNPAANLPTETPAVTSAPLGFAPGDCAFDEPVLNLEPECGYLTVPENRTEANGRTIRLPVAVFKSASANRKPDPIVYLDGGPGGDTMQEVLGLYFSFGALIKDRDLILFGQRGVESSLPSLDCPELSQLNYDYLERKFSVDEKVAQDAAAANKCHDRLVSEGIDPALATSAENAADVADLRVALGYEQWNLFGISYGTKLALTVMRDHPEGVRSVVIDSVYPPQVNFYEEWPADYDRALNALFAACAADVACNAAYPDLEAAFYETVNRLNEKPVLVTLGTFFDRPIEGAEIDGDWFAAFMFSSLYSADLIRLLPRAIFDTRDGNYDLLTVLADAYLQDSKGLSWGMYLSVQCGEELPFTTLDAAITAADAYPRLQSYNEYQAKSAFAGCDAWQADAAAAPENEPVTSSIPTLVLAGEFDPITPPEWGRIAAQNLTNSFFFEFPGVGHGVAFSGQCPFQITQAFLDDPASEPPSGCIAGMGGPNWIIE